MNIVEVFKEFDKILDYLQDQVNKITSEGITPTSTLNPVPTRAVNTGAFTGGKKRKPINRKLNVRKLALGFNGISIIEEECMLMLSETKIYIPDGPSYNSNTITDETIDKAEDLLVDRLIIMRIKSGQEVYNYYLTPETERPFIFKVDDYIVSISSMSGINIYTNMVYNSILKRILIENEI